MKNLVTKTVEKGNEKRVSLIFGYDRETIENIKLLEDRKWSVSERYWHIPYYENYLQNLNRKFNKQIIFLSE